MSKVINIQNAEYDTANAINYTTFVYRQVCNDNDLDDGFDLIKLAVTNYCINKGTVSERRQHEIAKDGVVTRHTHIDGTRYRWKVQLIPDHGKEEPVNIFQQCY